MQKSSNHINLHNFSHPPIMVMHAPLSFLTLEDATINISEYEVLIIVSKSTSQKHFVSSYGYYGYYHQ